MHDCAPANLPPVKLSHFSLAARCSFTQLANVYIFIHTIDRNLNVRRQKGILN
jgi:hypothetical protein